jgi:hypothetical protein
LTTILFKGTIKIKRKPIEDKFNVKIKTQRFARLLLKPTLRIQSHSIF